MQKVLQTALSAGLSATEGIHSSKPKPVPKDFDGMQYVQPSSFVPNPQERITLKGKYAEVQISFLSIGAWSWGDTATWHWRDDELPALQEAWRTLVEGGINYIDTAQAYGSGKSEEICGELVQGLPRESYVMQTKYYVVPQPKNIVSPSGDVVSALEKSLKRMNLDCMDVYMVHGPIHPGTYAAVAKGLNECVEKKLCKVVAVANYDEKDMIKMYDALQEYGIPLALNQCEYSILRRIPETSGLLKACRERGIQLQSYSSLAQGRLTGKWSAEKEPPKTYRFSSYPMKYLEPTLEMVKKIAVAHNVTMAAVALNYNLSKGVIPVVGVRNMEQAQSNLQALGWRLSNEEMRMLDDVSLEGKTTMLWQQG